MKRLIPAVILIAIPFCAQAQKKDSTSLKQEIKQGAKQVGSDVKEGAKEVSKEAKKVGNKSAQIGVKTYSRLKDKVYKGKQGPNGETIYIDKKSEYYYVDTKGHKVYLLAEELRDKPAR